MVTEQRQLDVIVAQAGHLYYESGCEKSAGAWDADHVLRCVHCGALFVECNPEICT